MPTRSNLRPRKLIAALLGSRSQRAGAGARFAERQCRFGLLCGRGRCGSHWCGKVVGQTELTTELLACTSRGFRGACQPAIQGFADGTALVRVANQGEAYEAAPGRQPAIERTPGCEQPAQGYAKVVCFRNLEDGQNALAAGRRDLARGDDLFA